MGLIRLIIIAVVGYLIWRAVSSLLSKPRTGTAPQPRRNQDSETMRRCEHCGVHVPEHQAFSHNGLHFCSQDHQRHYLENHER